MARRTRPRAGRGCQEMIRAGASRSAGIVALRANVQLIHTRAPNQTSRAAGAAIRSRRMRSLPRCRLPPGMAAGPDEGFSRCMGSSWHWMDATVCIRGQGWLTRVGTIGSNRTSRLAGAAISSRCMGSWPRCRFPTGQAVNTGAHGCGAGCGLLTLLGVFVVLGGRGRNLNGSQ